MPSQNGGAPAPVGIIRERSGDGLSAWRAHTPGGAGRPRSRPASREKPHLRPLTLAQSAGVDRQVVEGRPYTPRAVVPDGLESTQDDGLQSSPVGQRPPGRPTVWTPSHMDPVAQALSGKDAAEVAARMRGRERRRLLVAATPDRYQAASRRHNRGRSPREWKTPPPQTRGRSRSLEQASRSPRPLGSATAACVQLSDAGTPPSRQFAFKGGSVKRHQANSASPDGLPPIAMRSTPTEVSPAKTAGSPRRDSAKAKTEPSFKDTPMEPFVNLQQLSGMWLGVSSGSLYMDSYLDRYQPSKIQPSTKPVLRRGSSWLEVQQSAARENLYAHGPFLEPHAVDATAVLKLQAIENMPRSPPPLYRPLNVEAEDRAPRGWHPRDNQQNAPFVGIVFEVASDQENRSLELGAGFYNQNPIQRRPSVDAVREKIANPCKCGIRYSSIGQSWKVDPDLDPSLSETASNMRRSLTGRWSVEPTAPSQPWKGVHKRRTSHDPISDGYTVQRSISTGGGLEVSGNKSMGRSFEHETDPPGGESTLTYIARKGPGAFHLVGAPIPSLQRDGYRSRCGRTLDAMQGHQDTSPLTHGSYSEWREDPAKLVCLLQFGLCAVRHLDKAWSCMFLLSLSFMQRRWLRLVFASDDVVFFLFLLPHVWLFRGRCLKGNSKCYTIRSERSRQSCCEWIGHEYQSHCHSSFLQPHVLTSPTHLFDSGRI